MESGWEEMLWGSLVVRSFVLPSPGVYLCCHYAWFWANAQAQDQTNLCVHLRPGQPADIPDSLAAVSVRASGSVRVLLRNSHHQAKGSGADRRHAGLSTD